MVLQSSLTAPRGTGLLIDGSRSSSSGTPGREQIFNSTSSAEASCLEPSVWCLPRSCRRSQGNPDTGDTKQDLWAPPRTPAEEAGRVAEISQHGLASIRTGQGTNSIAHTSSQPVGPSSRGDKASAKRAVCPLPQEQAPVLRVCPHPEGPSRAPRSHQCHWRGSAAGWELQQGWGEQRARAWHASRPGCARRVFHF